MNRRLHTPSRQRRLVLAFASMAAVAFAGAHLLPGRFRVGAQGAGCTPPSGNPIVCENQLAGTPDAVWDVNGSGDDTIQGFSTDISVNRGTTIQFKINTPAKIYHLDIYRM